MVRQYIDKSTLLAEIGRYKHKADERLKIKDRTLAEDLKDLALQNLCGNLIHFINTLEVKEVDLEKEYQEFVVEDPVYNKLVNSIVGKAIAKHFFELGMKANNVSNSFEATICKVGNTYLKEMDKDAITKTLESYKDGDKVKVIIIKDK